LEASLAIAVSDVRNRHLARRREFAQRRRPNPHYSTPILAISLSSPARTRWSEPRGSLGRTPNRRWRPRGASRFHPILRHSGPSRVIAL